MISAMYLHSNHSYYRFYRFFFVEKPSESPFPEGKVQRPAGDEPFNVTLSPDISNYVFFSGKPATIPEAIFHLSERP